MEKQSHLPIGYRLQEYQIEKILGQGGFGITYLATDVNLDKQIVIKEFFPKEFSSRESNVYSVLSHKGEENEVYKYLLKKFLAEAKILASLSHPNIVTVTRFFEENSTAYFIMDYVKGESLKSYIDRNGSLSQGDIEKVIIPLLEGLKNVHEQDFLHRDIAPDNIYLTMEGNPMLIDFGSAKDIIGDESKSLATIVKAGYSAPEQYISNSTHTKSTDIYAMGGVILSMMSGNTPPEATKRQLELYSDMPDPLRELVDKDKEKYSKSFLEAVYKAMSIKTKDRFQEVGEFQHALIGEDTPIDNIEPILEDKKNEVKTKKNYLFILFPILFFMVGGVAYTMFSNTEKLQTKIIGNKKDTSLVSDINKTIVKNEELNNTKLLIDINKTMLKKQEINKTIVKSEELNNTKLSIDINKTMVKKEEINKKIVKKESKNSVSVTYNLALMYDYGRGVKEDKDKAINLYLETCELNNSKGCERLGQIYQKGVKVKKDINKTIKFYQKSCDLGNASACKGLGFIYFQGILLKRDIKKFIENYNKGCNLKSKKSCANLGLIYDQGIEVIKDKKKAVSFYKRGCDLNSSRSCANLGYMYDEGDGIVKNDTMAVKLYEKACSLKEKQSCFNLGMMYSQGEGILESKDKSIASYKKACDLNHKEACMKLK